MTYPKISNLFKRTHDTKKIIISEYARPEFDVIAYWAVTEKIDGTNIRVMLDKEGNITFGGRTNKAQIPADLLNYLKNTFTKERVHSTFPPNDEDRFPEITIFGEGYGPKIQNGGKYRDSVSFALFDVRVGNIWLEPNNTIKIANHLEIEHVPFIGECMSTEMLLDMFTGPNKNETPYLSAIAQKDNAKSEGIVAKSNPLLLTRLGERVMFKLKWVDFE